MFFLKKVRNFEKVRSFQKSPEFLKRSGVLKKVRGFEKDPEFFIFTLPYLGGPEHNAGLNGRVRADSLYL